MGGNRAFVYLLSALVLAGAGCYLPNPPPGPKATKAATVTLRPGPNVQEETQKALIEAQPGTTILFEEGTFEFTQGLSLASEGVTLRGKGMDRTTLSFKNQSAGSAGLTVTRGKFVIEDLSIDDAKGDALKVTDADGVQMRRVRAQWTGDANEKNGPYGLYPVTCKNVLIEDCVAIGASDAGIYVGQSQNVVVRRCRAERNVAGIEIENCTDADAYENVATNNAGGLLVFDMPGLPVKHGQRARVFKNEVKANNHPNFAPKGNIVASVPPGTGVVIMAADQVEVFQNTIVDNNTYNVAVLSFYVTGRPIEDKDYDPIPEGVSIHDNKINGGGKSPGGERGMILAALLGTPLPDIVYDGIVNPARLVDGKLPEAMGLSIRNNGDITFANLHWDQLNEKDLAGSRAKVTRDLKPHDFPLPPLEGVKLDLADK
jgi:parallel beta-helix repeat protein